MSTTQSKMIAAAAELKLSSTFSSIPNDLGKAADYSEQTPTPSALCARIHAAAIKCDTMHVFVNYAAHTKELTVCVRDSIMDYSAPVATWPEPLLYESVYLDGRWNDPITELAAIIDQLQLLGVEV